MERYREELTRIRNLLRAHPRGLTITDLSRRIGVNRNSVAKYLDVLITSGHVEKKAVGPAKVYFLSPRVPVSALLNLSSDYIIMLDEQAKIWHVNNSLLAFEGRSREEVIGRGVEDAPLLLLRDPDIQARISRGVADGEFSTEVDVKKGEEVFHFRATLVCTILEDGSRGTTMIFEDITVQKRNAESLRASEARYRAVVESQTEFVCRFRPDGTHVFVNEAYCRYFGKARDEIEGHVFRPEIPAEDRDALRTHFEGLTPEYPLNSIEHRILMPDGSLRWQRWIDRAIFDEDGVVTEYQSVGRDTTENRLTEERLRESEEKFRSIIERVFDVILVTDEEGRITYASPSLRQSTGYNPGEILGTPIFDFIPPADLPRATHAFERVRKGLPPQGLEIGVKRKDGTLGNLEIRTTSIWKEGKFAGVQVICRDITARVHAEEALRESLEKTRSVFEASPDGICLTDENGILVETNHAMEEISGIPREQALGKPIWEIAHLVLPPGMIPSGGIDQVHSEFQRFLSTGRSPFLQAPMEFTGKHPDGTSRTIQVRNFIIASKKGYRMGSIIRDLSTQKGTQEALRHSEEKFREMAEISPFPIAIIDGSGRYRYINRRFTDTFGYTLDDIPDGRRWFELAFPDPVERSRAIQAWKDDLAAFGVGMVRPRQFQVRCRNGECREILFRPVTMRDGNQFVTYEGIPDRIHVPDQGVAGEESTSRNPPGTRGPMV
jgi:PAS domain S-box-containing protein